MSCCTVEPRYYLRIPAVPRSHGIGARRGLPLGSLVGRVKITVAAIVAIVGGQLGSAAAEPDETKQPVSFWSVSFLGGVLSPMGTMKETHKRGLSAGARIAWTHKTGLGIEVQTEYSPLPRTNLMPLETYETHFGVATIGPRFILGSGFARAWIGGGGGVAFERSARKYRGAVDDTETTVVPVINAASGLELHIMNNGGLVLSGAYTKSYKTSDVRKYYSLVGGLVFTFK